MTPVAVKWVYVRRSPDSSAGELRPALCARGVADAACLTTIRDRVMVVRRTHQQYDDAPGVHDDTECVGVRRVLNDMRGLELLSAAASQLFSWFDAARYGEVGVLDTSAFRSDES